MFAPTLYEAQPARGLCCFHPRNTGSLKKKKHRKRKTTTFTVKTTSFVRLHAVENKRYQSYILQIWIGEQPAHTMYHVTQTIHPPLRVKDTQAAEVDLKCVWVNRRTQDRAKDPG